jgi:D-alanyl-D-alanine carboxypeptidase/D-alanyl-D-alanine-endopeptidase (penicillin-binding protein 4)
MRVLSLTALVFALAAGTAGAGTGSLHDRLAETLHIKGVVAASSTAMVVSLPTGHVVFARNANVPLEPASNEKLGVTFTALTELGASYRYPTEVLGQGHRAGDTWVGRLILKGFGDPALTSVDLNRLAGILWREGIRRVTGGVAGDATVFDAEHTAPGWLPSFAGTESPPLSALIVDRGARNGRVVANPTLAAAARFDALLHKRGIQARGATTGRAWPQSAVLATIYSPPLSEIIQFMDHWSDNFTAEMVLKTIGYKSLDRGTTAAGASVVRRDLRNAGVPLAGVRIADGSGLSRLDRVTASELTTLLVRIWNDPAMRRVVWASLPVAGQAGTLQNRFLDTPHHSLVRAKTGTTDIASALSGYVGTRYAFVAIENGEPVDYWAAHESEDGLVEALLDQVGAG